MCDIKKCKRDGYLIWLRKDLCLNHWQECCHTTKVVFLLTYNISFKGRVTMQEIQRTVRDFVEDMLSDGKSAKKIITVARNSHWESVLSEVKEVISSFSGKIKRKFTNI